MKIYTYRNIKIALSGAAVAFLLGLSGCDKQLLDALPTDRLSEDIFWKSEADAELAINALYNDLDGADIFFSDALTDIGHVNQPFEIDAFIELGTYDASSSRLSNTWKNAYKGIGAANYFLANVNKLETSGDSEIIARLIAEARVLRAYQYIKLITFFGEVPLVTTPLTLLEGRNVKRATYKELYDFVDVELQDAALDLPKSYNSTNVGRITKWAALGLKSRIDLYAGRYEAAALVAKTIIDEGQFDLYPSYQKLFSYEAENNKEILLDKQFLENTNAQNVFYLLAPYSLQGAQSTYVPTKALVDQYETAGGLLISDAKSGYNPKDPYKNRDPRLYFSVFLDGDILPNDKVFHPAPNSGTAHAVGSTYVASTTGFNVKKYMDKKDYANPKKSGLNIILLRFAEILLIYAEAKIEMGQVDPTVFTAINRVRNSRNDVKLPSLATTNDLETLREAVRRERTAELAFEGLHLADVRRWKTAEKVLPGKVFGITYKANDGQVQVVQTASESRIFNAEKHYLWPVPQKEIDLNSNLSQNPNW